MIRLATLLIPLAHDTPAPPTEPSVALTVLTVAAMIFPFFVLGAVCWVFWRAKKREDEAKRGTPQAVSHDPTT